MACIDDVLKAAKVIVETKCINEFRTGEIVEYLKRKNRSPYTIPSIRGAVVSRCCVEAPNHTAEHAYFSRVRRGVYRLLQV